MPPQLRFALGRGGTALPTLARIVPFLAIALGLATVLWATTRRGRSTTTYAGPQIAVYSPQPERNAEWTAIYPQYSDDQVTKLAQNTSYVVDNSFSASHTVASHFANVQKLVTSAQQDGNHLAVLSSFDSIFTYTGELSYWRPYTAGFNPNWYLRDTHGNPIAYVSAACRGPGPRCTGPRVPVGYLYDLTNPAYRAWAVHFITTVMQAAPYKGVLLDSADQIVGYRPWGSIESLGSPSHTSSLNELLCPPSAPVDANGDCPKVVAWNASLATFVSEVQARLRPLGDTVVVNGIAPSPFRRGYRNLAMVSHADLATNEAFCYHTTLPYTSRPLLDELLPDLRIMRLLAEQQKGVIEITNRSTSSGPPTGDYCLAGFLMGWQPGSSYYMYHRGYRDPLVGQYPEIPEQDLNLGLPRTPDYGQSGSLLYRRFQHGFVAVNAGGAPVDFTVPAAATEFDGGVERGAVRAGETVKLSPLSARFFLSADYLCAGAPATKTPFTQPIVKASDGNLVLRSAALADGPATMTYSLDGAHVNSTARFPSSYQLDMRRYSPGTHTLLIAYHYPDGRFSAAARCVSVRSGAGSTTGWFWVGACAMMLGTLIYCGRCRIARRRGPFRRSADPAELGSSRHPA